MKQPDQHVINSLLEKHSLGILTPEENALLEKWYADFPQEGSVWTDAAERTAMKDALRAEIFDKITTPAVRRPTRWIWWTAAAAVVTMLVVISQVFQKAEPATIITRAPGGKGVVKMVLPDQSEMWLEPGTVVQYERDFGQRDRRVTLVDGRAYFEVRQGSANPFVVSVPGNIMVKVLGTGFTVKKYMQAPTMEVMVNNGAVQVADSTGAAIILKAGQQLSLQTNISTGTKTTEMVEDWRDGALMLHNASVAEIARVLEGRFGLQVTYDTATVGSYLISFRIAKDDSAGEILEMLREISGIKCTRTGSKVHIH